MAQTGSFVPARVARIGTVDRVFSRIGASDNLARGESSRDSEESMDWRLQGGTVEMPDLYSMGTPGGRLYSARLDAAFRGGDGDAVFQGRFGLFFNDPEQLVLYPFARNVLSYRMSLEGAF